MNTCHQCAQPSSRLSAWNIKNSYCYYNFHLYLWKPWAQFRTEKFSHKLKRVEKYEKKSMKNTPPPVSTSNVYLQCLPPIILAIRSDIEIVTSGCLIETHGRDPRPWDIKVLYQHFIWEGGKCLSLTAFVEKISTAGWLDNPKSHFNIFFSLMKCVPRL